MSSDDSFFELHRTDLLKRWGDYGTVLCNGLCMERETRDQICLGRTGPFVPPITFPLASSSVVVTDKAKQQIESANLTGIGNFRPVLLEKAVAIDWSVWDANKDLSDAQLPFNGEPEEYILHNSNDIESFSQIEPLWSWHPLEIGKVVRHKGSLQVEGILGVYDVFRLQDKWWSEIIVGEKGKQTLSGIFENWVTFRELNAKVKS